MISRLTISRWLAYVFGALTPLAETVRRWQLVGASAGVSRRLASRRIPHRRRVGDEGSSGGAWPDGAGCGVGFCLRYGLQQRDISLVRHARRANRSCADSVAVGLRHQDRWRLAVRRRPRFDAYRKPKRRLGAFDEWLTPGMMDTLHRSMPLIETARRDGYRLFPAVSSSGDYGGAGIALVCGQRARLGANQDENAHAGVLCGLAMAFCRRREMSFLTSRARNDFVPSGQFL